MQWQTTLWQQDGWVKAVAHSACVHYDSCTGQHKLVNKGVSGQNCVVIWLHTVGIGMGEFFYFFESTQLAHQLQQERTQMKVQ